MTNVDLEGFRDWNDKELEEALRFIKDELKDRQRKKIDEALLKVKEALNALQKECDIELSFDGNLEELYYVIKAEVERV
jgi:hypothetical protein